MTPVRREENELFKAHMSDIAWRQERDGVLVQQPANRIDLRAEQVNILLEGFRLVNRVGDEGLEGLIRHQEASKDGQHVRRPLGGTPHEHGGVRRARRRRSP